jgi:hypothetical protein
MKTPVAIVPCPSYDPELLVDAASRGAWVSGLDGIEIKGLSIDEARPSSFQLLPLGSDRQFFTERLPTPIRRLVRDTTVARPFFDHAKRIRSGGCHEVCPEDAISLRKRVF